MIGLRLRGYGRGGKSYEGRRQKAEGRTKKDLSRAALFILPSALCLLPSAFIMNWQSFPSASSLADHAAARLLSAIRTNPQTVLGLPTGRTPIGMYERVVRECEREYHCFRDVVTFNLDEYAGVPREHPGSYYAYMKQHLFDH